MKTPSLIVFGAVILIGWTSLAGGVIAVFAGDPASSHKSHTHQEEIAPTLDQGPLISDAPCAFDAAPDASVPCPA